MDETDEGVNIGNRAILAATSDVGDNINSKVMDIFPSTDSETYYSADSVSDEQQARLYPVEFLNSLTPSGVPPHKLHLKKHAPIMLIRNLSPSQGLLSGTRLKIVSLGKHIIEAIITTGKHVGQSVFLPRVIITPSDSELPFDLKGRQFPIRPAFALTINKAQGQTLEYIGLELTEPVFTYGQCAHVIFGTFVLQVDSNTGAN
ncbi:ATP-dependent DNA helicase PIF1-like [Glandiceps talaboti]